MNKQKIILGDALHELKKMKSNSVDLIIADPPYNLGKDYGNGSDKKQFSEYLDFSKEWIGQAKRVLSNKGSMFVFMGFRFISHLYRIFESDFGMNFRNWICWHYTQGSGKTKGFSPRHDDILLFSKTKDFIFNLDEIRIPQKYHRVRNNMRGANPGDVWQFSHVHYSNENRFRHPTQKPEGIIERMVLSSSVADNVVLDPFLGSGTTLRVCQQLKRKGTGIELNPEYVEMAKKRLSLPFQGFDSIDPRMYRVPRDLRKPEMRKQYLLNHRNWFLKNHENSMSLFRETVEATYGKNVLIESLGVDEDNSKLSSYSALSFLDQLEA